MNRNIRIESIDDKFENSDRDISSIYIPVSSAPRLVDTSSLNQAQNIDLEYEMTVGGSHLLRFIFCLSLHTKPD